MANTAAAKKDVRQTKKRTAINTAKKRTIHDLLKQTLEAIEKKDPKAQELVSKTFKALDKAAKSNTVHANKASRMKGRIQKKLNASK